MHKVTRTFTCPRRDTCILHSDGNVSSHQEINFVDFNTYSEPRTDKTTPENWLKFFF